MRIIVTGGTGFIGRCLIKQLRNAGHDVSTVSRRSSNDLTGIRHYQADVRFPDAFRDIPRADAIVHLAGLADVALSFTNPPLYGQVNAMGTLHMLEIACEMSSLFVLASSQRVYRPKREPMAEDDDKKPADPYGYSKLVAEEWVAMYQRLYGLRTIVLRFFSVFGPGQAVSSGTSGVVSQFLARAGSDQALMANNRNLRDFTYVTDVANGVSLALENPAAVGNTFNIATGRGTCIEELAETVKDVTRSSCAIISQEVSGDDSYVADITRAMSVLGYVPRIDLRQGLELYAEELLRAR